MDANESMRTKFAFFDVLREHYDASFGKREWDGMALNYYYHKRKPFTVVFSWNWRTRQGESLVAEIQIRNEQGGDKLYKYLEREYLHYKPLEWFVMPGMSRIIHEIDPEVDLRALLMNKNYTVNLIDKAADAMSFLEEEFLSLIDKYFELFV
jgi:hypothetical protein